MNTPEAFEKGWQAAHCDNRWRKRNPFNEDNGEKELFLAWNIGFNRCFEEYYLEEFLATMPEGNAYQKHYKWTEKQNQIIRDYYQDGAFACTIRIYQECGINRSPGAVRTQARKIGEASKKLGAPHRK